MAESTGHSGRSPPALRATLAPPLPGYDYGYADGGVILFGTSDRVVVDFVLSY